jgi:hypothetical protein
MECPWKVQARPGLDHLKAAKRPRSITERIHETPLYMIHIYNICWHFLSEGVFLHQMTFSWEEKLVAPLIAAPNGEMLKWEDKGTEHKCLTTGYACNCNAKEITFFFANKLDEVLI